LQKKYILIFNVLIFLTLQKSGKLNLIKILSGITIVCFITLGGLKDLQGLYHIYFHLTGFEMVNEICRDMLKLLAIKENCLQTIMDISDYGTENMIK